MSRAPNERPARRLDAILDTIRRHGVVEFEAAKLEGIGEGLKFLFGPPVARSRAAGQVSRAGTVDPDLAPGAEGEPIDELALVAKGLDGPVTERNGVS